MNNKYFTLWLCVSLGALVIIIGWVFSIRYNMAQIDLEMQNKATESEGKIAEFESIVSDMKNQMDENWEKLKLEVANENNQPLTIEDDEETVDLPKLEDVK